MRANTAENEEFSAKNECYKSAGVCLGRLQFGIAAVRYASEGKRGFYPVEPKPPAPRAVSLNSSDHAAVGVAIFSMIS